MHACCTLYNFILEQNGALPDTGETISSYGVQSEEAGNVADLARVFRPYTQRESDEWHAFRESFANKIWDEYQMIRTHGSV